MAIFEMFVGTILLTLVVLASLSVLVGVVTLRSAYKEVKLMNQNAKFRYVIDQDKLIKMVIIPLIFLVCFGIVHWMVI
jgi:hypothetical protein